MKTKQLNFLGSAQWLFDKGCWEKIINLVSSLFINNEPLIMELSLKPLSRKYLRKDGILYNKVSAR